MMEYIKKEPVKSGIFVGLFLALILMVFFFARWWNAPLGAELAEETDTASKEMTQAIPEETLIPTTIVPTVKKETKTPTETATLSPSPTIPPVTICDGPETMFVQVTGVEGISYLYGLADAIRVIRLDFVNGKITVLHLPRDMYVSIPIAVPGVTESVTLGKLNQAYFYGSSGMGYYDGEDQAPGLLAQTIEENFNLKIDNYISVNTRIFRMMVDAIGGIDVYLPDNVFEHYFQEPVLYMEAGVHHLDGKQAEMIARHRTLIGDFGRVKNQTILFKAFSRNLLTPEGLASLPDLVAIYKETVLIDFTPDEISTILCLLSKIDNNEDITYIDFPLDLLEEIRVYDKVQKHNVYVLDPDLNAVIEFLDKFQKGIIP
jgi:LCP family protein required for cell wall assembly